MSQSGVSIPRQTLNRTSALLRCRVITAVLSVALTSIAAGCSGGLAHRLLKPFDAHCCHMGTAAVKHPVPDRVKPSFVIFDIRAL